MPSKNRVFVVGGTGFLGYHAILEFLDNGWEATAIGLPPAPPVDLFPSGVRVVLCDLDTSTNKELLDLLRGHTVLIYAAGMDDRYTPKKPAYPKFRHANVEVPARVLMLAAKSGIKHAVVFGSYFAYFNRVWPGMKLAERHPYIRSRVEQESVVTSLPGLDVDVLELPYIFGDPLGRKPLWSPLVKYIRSFPQVLYMHGGTACITAKTVGKAAFSTVVRGHPGICYPIGQNNLTWTQMLTRLALADGLNIRVRLLPYWVVKLSMLIVFLVHKLQGKEGGLNLLHFASLQTAYTYLDPELSQKELGYELDDLDESFQKTVKACKE